MRVNVEINCELEDLYAIICEGKIKSEFVEAVKARIENIIPKDLEIRYKDNVSCISSITMDVLSVNVSNVFLTGEVTWRR